MHREHNDRDKDAVRSEEDRLMEQIKAHRSRMYGIAYAYMRNETDALEAIQETVCRVWLKRHTLRDERLLATWMIRILIRVCMDERRKRKRIRPYHETEWLSDVSRPGNEGNRDESDRYAIRLDMAEEVKKLPPKHRMVIVLKYYRDMTVAEIAELLDKPEGTVKTWLHKALQKLKSNLALAAGKEEKSRENNLGTEWSKG